eukprot:gnl/Dysnectes_brevis/563_a621_4297.p1 GENE.gnl/Dysnectes_brevis/563_a621_4297~~gnl/Dysnectes_brevis/563_a621_4297.p1  ORF type:complete len:339 (+),score=43.26 gnl/Dysnectes_brevis/563_a621_4297:68-1084(+)
MFLSARLAQSAASNGPAEPLRPLLGATLSELNDESSEISHETLKLFQLLLRHHLIAQEALEGGAIESLAPIIAYHLPSSSTPVTATPSLTPMVSSPLPSQSSSFAIPILYRSIACVWALSFQPAASKHILKSGALGFLARLLRSPEGRKEKLVRVCLATLNNITSDSEAVTAMLGVNLDRTLRSLSTGRWADPDVELLVQELQASIRSRIGRMSTWEAYTAELASGVLDWTPPHRSSTFWKANAHRLLEHKSELLHRLVELIVSSSDHDIRTKTVAVNDLGQFATTHPRGREWLARIPRAKPTVMSLLDHPDPELAREAMGTMSKMLVSNWAFIAKDL